MPKKKVVPVEVSVRGKRMWRVIVPKDLNEGKRRTRFFVKKTDADEFANETERQRVLELPKEFYGYNQHDQASILKAAKLAGNADNLLKAAEEFARSPNRGIKTAYAKDLLADLQAAKRSSGASLAYLKKLRWTLKNFATTFPETPLHQITGQDVEEWLSKNQTWGQIAKRNAVADVSVLFSFAVSRGCLGVNLIKGMKRPARSGKPPAILTPKQASEFMERIQKKDKGLIRYFALRFFGGLRASEASQSAPERIKTDHVEVYSKKTHKRRLIEMNQALRAWLVLGGDWPIRNLKHRIEKLFEPNEIPQNAIRHSFCSYSFAIHGPGRTAKESGHSEKVLEHDYKELVLVKDANRYFSIKPKKSGDTLKPMINPPK